MTTTQFQYQFVAAGTVASPNLPDNEIWLDVGNRAAPGVLDHHGGDTDALSASELAFHRFDQLVRSHISAEPVITLTLHTKPDLDAICAAWLVTQAVDQPLPIQTHQVLSPLIDMVSANDQGLVQTQQPASCWTVVFQERMKQELPPSASDKERVGLGFQLLNQTLEGLSNGQSLEYIAGQLITSAVESSLAESENTYLQDLENGERFQVYLPTQKSEITSMQKPIAPPPATGAKARLVDGLYLKNPSSTLFRELARGDRERSPLGQGFSFMVVQHDLQHSHHQQPLSRYILSTNPITDFHLQGLGRMLELHEQEAENRQQNTLLPGRERVGDGKGRHGYNVVSPWYDGRGHNFTIIDCPGVTIDQQILYASRLSATEIRVVVQAYSYLFSGSISNQY